MEGVSVMNPNLPTKERTPYDLKESSVDLEANNRSSSISSSNSIFNLAVATSNRTPIQDYNSKLKDGTPYNNSIITTLCDFAIRKYGPSFSTMVKNVLPFMKDTVPHRIVCSDEFVSYIMDSIDIEQGYTKKELEMMNDPILEFVSTLPPTERDEEEKRNAIGIFNLRINSVLDYFYDELLEES
jgi:hypothetical protein